MIYRRGGVYWYKFRWSIKRKDGTRESYLIRRSTRASNLKKAGEAEEEHRRALRLGQIHPADPWPKVEPRPPTIPTLKEFSTQFLAYSKVHTKPGTLRFYEIAINRILLYPQLAHLQLTEVTGELVTRYAQWRRGDNRSSSILSINGELRTLRRLFYLAEEWGVIAKAPSVHELSGGKGRERVVSFAEELRYLANASRTVRDAAILAVDTGLRPNSELFPLRWSNVRLENTQEAPQGFIHVPEGKTDAAIRNVPLTPRAREVLEVRKALMIGPKNHKRRCGDQKYVFPGSGNSGHLVTVQHAHEKTMADADLESFEFYCWRHTFGTRCAESGMDKFSLARLMGHSSPRVAERYYVHVTEPHVLTGFERFVSYQITKQEEAFRAASKRIQ